MEDLIIYMLIAYKIGYVLAYFWENRVSSYNYRINGKKEIENYILNKQYCE